MENLNLTNTKYAIEMLRKHGVSNGGTLGFHAGWCDIAADQLESALSLIKEQEQKIFELENRLKECENGYEGTLFLDRCKLHDAEEEIKKLTQAHEMLSESYDHLKKTKDELLAERSRLADENERLRATVAIADGERKCRLDVLRKSIYKAKADTVRKMKEIITKKCAVSNVHYVYNAEPTITYELTNWELDRIEKEMLEDTYEMQK